MFVHSPLNNVKAGPGVPTLCAAFQSGQENSHLTDTCESRDSLLKPKTLERDGGSVLVVSASESTAWWQFVGAKWVVTRAEMCP